MLFLENENKIIKEVLGGRLGEKAPRPVEPLEIRLCDFDDVQYDISIANNLLTISMSYPPYKTLEGLGVQQMFSTTYPEFTIAPTKAGYDLSLQVNVDVITPTNSASFIERIAALKRNILAAPFEHCFEALHNGNATSLTPVQIPFRRTETIYVLPQADRIVIVYSICFDDKTDQAIARVFLQDFVDTRRTVNNAPPAAFSKDPPLELRGASGLRNSPDLVGYLSLAIFPSHVDTKEKRINAASLVQGLRNYLHYHIKASKTYLHIRMRKRVDLLLQASHRRLFGTMLIASSTRRVAATVNGRACRDALRRSSSITAVRFFSDNSTISTSSVNSNPLGGDAALTTPSKPPTKATSQTTWQSIVIGEIVSFHPHPSADRLNICHVNVGEPQNMLQIICGAPNVQQGAKVPVAKIGTKLAMKDAESGEVKLVKIKKSKLRGEMSQGMICSEEELGLAEKSDGIFILTEDAPVGKLIQDWEAIASRLTREKQNETE